MYRDRSLGPSQGAPRRRSAAGPAPAPRGGTPSDGRRPALLVAALAGACLLLGGCRSASSAALNLRRLHAEDGAVRERPQLYGGLQYAFAQLTGGLDDDVSGEGAAIGRPQARALDEFVRLAAYDGADRRLVNAQTELAAFLATASRSQMVREAAIRLLGRLGRRLEVTRIDQLEDGAAAAPEEVDAVAARLDPDASEAALADVRGRIAALALDLDGALTLLRRVDDLRDLSRGQREALDLDGLTHALRVRCVQLALGRAIRDPREWVRAAAVDETLTLQPDLTAEIWAAAIEGRALRLVEVCARAVAERGPAAEPTDRDRWIELAASSVDLGIGYGDGPVTVAGCDALARLAPIDLETLRAEEWLLWYDEYRQSHTATAAPAGEVDE